MTAQPFLITGLPRSRTAWLSAVANTVPGAVCYHEPIEWVPSWQASLDLWKRDDRVYVGISDASLGFHLADILRSHRPRTLVIKRPIDAVVGSSAAIGMKSGVARFCEVLDGRIRAAENHQLVEVVSFDALRDPSVVVACLEHLMPGAVIDREKVEIFGRLNVQSDVERVTRVMGERARAGEIPALLGPEIFREVVA